MDWGLFNMSVHIVVIKFVPSAIHVMRAIPQHLYLSYTREH